LINIKPIYGRLNNIIWNMLGICRNSFRVLFNRIRIKVNIRIRIRVRTRTRVRAMIKIMENNRIVMRMKVKDFQEVNKFNN
jgi:hypothetical protein